MKNLKLIPVLFFIGFSMMSCEKDDPIIPNEEELITTLLYTLTPEVGESVVMSFVDMDGDGGVDPVITGGTLAANTTYSGVIQLLNEQSSPAEDITAEVIEEAVDHQFFISSDIIGMQIGYADMDSNNFPLGVQTTLSTGATDSGILTIILRHEPNKAGLNVADGDIQNAGGETDIQVNFTVDVQ